MILSAQDGYLSVRFLRRMSKNCDVMTHIIDSINSYIRTQLLSREQCLHLHWGRIEEGEVLLSIRTKHIYNKQKVQASFGHGRDAKAWGASTYLPVRQIKKNNKSDFLKADKM